MTLIRISLPFTDLHRERIQSMAMTGSNPVQPVSSEMMEHILFEEELDLQIALLKQHNEDASIMPESRNSMETPLSFKRAIMIGNTTPF